MITNLLILLYNSRIVTLLNNIDFKFLFRHWNIFLDIIYLFAQSNQLKFNVIEISDLTLNFIV